MKKYLIFFFLLSSAAFAQRPSAELSFSNKQSLSSGFADILEDLMPAVVNIFAIEEVASNANGAIDQSLLNELQKTPMLEEFRNRLESQLRNNQGQKKKVSSIGSGFAISKDGFIVTNSHVIEEADEIIVSLNDGTKHKAKVIGIDKKTDLALLKIEVSEDLKFVKFGDSTKSRIGDWVIVVGNPYGLGGSVSVGIISAKSRDINNGQIEEYIQTDAAINKGNSGGPMFNVKGEVIGISSAIYSPSGGSVGIGFATPSSTATQVIKQLKDQGEVVRGWFGVSVQDVTEEMAESMGMEKVQGAFVTEVANGGPADKAGILPTDIITKFDNQEITEMKLLPRVVNQTEIGKIVKVVVLRRGKVKTLTAKVERMKSEFYKKQDGVKIDKKQSSKPSAPLLGMILAELNATIKKGDNLNANIKGLLVVDVVIKSEAAQKGVVMGDIILSANQVPITTIDELKNIVEESRKNKKKLFLFIKRGDTNQAIILSNF
jgi:serine protease Do